MAEAGQHNVLGQKAQAAQRVFEARGMSLTKAVRRALSRTADVLWDLALVVHTVRVDLQDQDGVIDLLKEDDLLLLLDGGRAGVGLVTMDRQLLTGLLEVQTLQQVTQLPPEDRPLTLTDAAMTAPLIDGTLKRLNEAMAEHSPQDKMETFCFGAMIEDARAAGLLLEAAEYQVIHATVDLALGRRRGEITFVLPRPPVAAQPKPDVAKAGPGPHAEGLVRVPARLEAVLARITLTLSEVERLRPGDLLELPKTMPDGVMLTAGRSGAVARGRLGQMQGMRALRLSWPPRAEPDPTSPVSEEADVVAGGLGKASPAQTAGRATAVTVPAIAHQDQPDIDIMSQPLPDLPFDEGFDVLDAAMNFGAT